MARPLESRQAQAVRRQARLVPLAQLAEIMLAQRLAGGAERLRDPGVDPAERQQEIDLVAVFAGRDVLRKAPFAKALGDRVTKQVELAQDFLGHGKKLSE